MSPTYQPVGRRRLADEIVEQIENLIVKSELHVGDPLPPERELARQLQVSRNALREAIGMLAQKGLVEIRPGSGTYIAQPTAGFIGDSLHFLLRLNPSGLLDLIHARLAIESEIAAMAAGNASAGQVQAIGAAVDLMETYRGQPDPYIEGDLAFHTELARAAGNQALLLIVMSLRAAMRENIRFFANEPGVANRAITYHRRIYEAVAAHRPDDARAAMHVHFAEFIAGLQAESQPHPAL